MTTKKRPRTERREAERRDAKVVRAKEMLTALEPGGSASRPIEVESASQIESHAKAMSCPICGDFYRVIDHEAAHISAGSSVRVVTVQSPQCGRKRTLYFAIRAALPN